MDPPQTTADYFKFCPGEEHIKISNAICRGRRKTNFPKCTSCQFNDDLQNTGTISAMPSLRNTAHVEAVFQPEQICATTPTPLSTDVAWRIGHAAGQYLHGKLRGYERAHPGSKSVVVGRDLRSSGPTLVLALADGVRSVGMDVIDLGVVDTPQLYYAVNHFNACGGIQATGGLMSADHNGFKLCGAKATPISDQTGLAGIRDIALRVPKHQTGVNARLREESVAAEYQSFIRSALVGAAVKRPLTIAIDAANGVAARWAPILFEGLGPITLSQVNFEIMEPFVHDPDPMIPANTAELRKRVKETGADLGVGYSGDASQCAFIDEKGAIVPCDLIGTLLARSFLERTRGAPVILDVRSSITLSDEIERAGGVAIRERVGYHHMRKRMNEANAIFGIDWTGRYYFRDHFGCESAFLAAMHVINLISVSGRTLSELVQPLVRYRSSSEMSFHCTDPNSSLERLVQSHSDAQIERLDGATIRYPDWRAHLRTQDGESALRIVVEAKTKKLMDQHMSAFESKLAYGLSRPTCAESI
ncbi:MAG: hypothetical protein AABZ08_08220 [Planctomycetota bacterium]